MENCPKCHEKLNIDEKASGRCFSCGTSFSSSIPKDSGESVHYTKDNATDNTVAKIIKIIGIVIIIFGTIGSIIIANVNQSVPTFFVAEFASIVSGMFFVGLSEIIRILEEIKNKP